MTPDTPAMDEKGQALKDIEACLDEAVSYLVDLAGAKPDRHSPHNCRLKIDEARFYARHLASLKASQEAEVVKLEWVCGEGNYEGQQVWHAGDPWLFWIVSDKFVWCETLNLEGFIPASPVRGSFDTFEDAQAAAQSDFESRIRSCLAIPQPAPDTEVKP